ncbi:FadR/GntR family transcriptional regulator [Streptomyces sp. NPDC019443]|uniref:FadR/GntR family transcriptional regulator n=1 Tax=Streptomyces sp. NPDC019443 TaxID=3365061 RepID=UPI0037B1FE91
MDGDGTTHNTGRHSIQSVADVLRERIRTGQLTVGERMPTQAQLAEEFGVQRGTVRQALRSLHDEGLLAGVTRGSPPRVAPPEVARGGDAPEPVKVALGTRLAEAFSAREVRIDAVCLTAESLLLALGEPLLMIHTGRVRPSTVEVRILLPDRDNGLAFPSPLGAPEDDQQLHQRWQAQRNALGQVLRHNLLSLRATIGCDVNVTFRALPFTPPVKLCLLNGSEALFAYYTVKRREVRIDDGPVEIYDMLGTDSTLFRFESGRGERDDAFVAQSQAWFDGLWGTISLDLKLG